MVVRENSDPSGWLVYGPDRQAHRHRASTALRHVGGISFREKFCQYTGSRFNLFRSKRGTSRSAFRVVRGVVVLVGYGIKIHVDCGHLTIEDGIGSDRRRGRFPRVHHGLRRLVVVGSDGFISLSAIQWLADQKISFAMLDRDGSVLLNTGPVAASDTRMRRAQACAHHQPIAIDIVRHLIDLKLEGQEAIARNKLRNANAADLIARHRSYLKKADTIDELRICEANGASVYWTAWQSLMLKFPQSDLPRVPDHWREFGTRRSPLSNTSRRPPNPVNAILNYLYTLLESETRLAINALGLDPGFGFLHLDHGVRDSLAYDLMEPIRPTIDAYVFDWISITPLKRSWFFEQRNGSCRLMSDLTVQLSDTASTCARKVAPIVEWYAETLSASLSDKGVPAASTRLTRRKRFEGKGSALPAGKPAPKQQNVCAGCGAIVSESCSYCDACAKEQSGKRLAEASVKRRIAAKSPEAAALKSAKMTAHRDAMANWNPAELPDASTATTSLRRSSPHSPASERKPSRMRLAFRSKRRTNLRREREFRRNGIG